jgi:hypothetical protein
VAAAARHHAGQDRAGDVDQALAVGVDHLVPVVEVGVLGRAETEREAGVVDEQVDRGEIAGERGNGGGHGVTVADVERHRQQRGAEFGGQVLEAVHPAGGRDDPGARGREPARDRGTEPAARTRDEHDFWLAAHNGCNRNGW